MPPKITQKGAVHARYVTICYIPLSLAARYVTICYKVKPEWRRYVTKKKLLLHSVAIRATLCNKLLHTVSLLHTVVHQCTLLLLVTHINNYSKRVITLFSGSMWVYRRGDLKTAIISSYRWAADGPLFEQK